MKGGGFTILDEITLTSISPASARTNDDSVDLSLAGSGLFDIRHAFLPNDDYENVTADDVDIASSKKITKTFDLSGTDEDTYDVCAEDSYGTVVCDFSFEITTGEVGSLEISSNPSGAVIYVDGTLAGTTPDTVEDPIEGSHKVVLKKSGYLDWGKIVKVGAGETTEVDADLTAVSPVPTPVLTTITEPVPATVPATSRTPVKSTIEIPTP